MRVRHLLTCLVVPVLLLTACGDDDADDVEREPVDETEETDDEQAEGPEAPADEGASEQELIETPVPEVTLLDAGDEPRAPLRLSPREGAETATTLTISSQQSADGAEDQEPISQTIDLALVVSEVDAGQATVDFEFTDASAAGMPEDQPDQSEQLVGIEGRMVIDEQARVTAATQTAQGVDEVLIPFPEEEVGPGASWEVVTESTEAFPVTERVLVELVSFDGQDYELEVTVSSEELEEPVEQEGMPGQTMTIEDLTIEGEGQVQGSLEDVFPRTASLINETAVVLDLGAGVDGEQTQQTRSELTLEEQ